MMGSVMTTDTTLIDLMSACASTQEETLDQLDDMETRMSRIESRLVQLMYFLNADPNGRYDQDRQP